jgi:uncharacterized membrane protein YciS (DUF1049 family)
MNTELLFINQKKKVAIAKGQHSDSQLLAHHWLELGKYRMKSHLGILHQRWVATMLVLLGILHIMLVLQA